MMPTQTELAGQTKESVAARLGAVDAIHCPTCRRRVFSSSEARVQLKTRILVFENGVAYAKCKHCRQDVVVPLALSEWSGEKCLPVWDEAVDGKTG